MAQTQGFIPKHSQPFTLAEAVALEIDTLAAEISRLRNSIAHLEATQRELNNFLSTADAEDDEDEELKRAFDENVAVIDSQRERIELIKMALQAKMGTDSARSHYGLGEDSREVRSEGGQVEAGAETREPQRVRTMLGGMEAEEAPPSARAVPRIEDGIHGDDGGDGGLHL